MTVEGKLDGFMQWPINRKLLLLGSVGVCATLFAALVNALAFSMVHIDAMNLRLLNSYIVVWLIAQILVTAACIPAARAGLAVRWPANLFIIVQSPFIVGLLQLYGTMGTPLVAIYPAIVILWTLVLDERFGLFGFSNLVAWMLVAGVLEMNGVLSYAPVLTERVIDFQNNPVWFGTVFFHILILLGFCTFLCVLLQRTQLAQSLRLHQAHEALEQANRLIRRYVPAQLGEKITAGLYVETAKPERNKLTIVSVGVERFIAAADALEAEDLASVLSDYLSEMVAVADRHGGTVSHIFGAGIMIFFGAPQFSSDRDHAHRALKMALEMLNRVERMADSWSKHGFDRPFRIKIGVNTGYVGVGDFGSDGRKIYSGIGLQTHIAEQIQIGCEHSNVLISHSTWTLVQDDMEWHALGEMPIKGVRDPVRVYAVLAPESETHFEGLAQATDDELISEDSDPVLTAVGNGVHSDGDLNTQIDSARVWTSLDVSFDERSLQLSVAGEIVELERKPVEVLRYLLWHAGDVVTRDELLDAIWPGKVLSDTVIAKCISRLRDVLHDHEQAAIKTVHGYGYRFVAEIKTGPRIVGRLDGGNSSVLVP